MKCPEMNTRTGIRSGHNMLYLVIVVACVCAPCMVKGASDNRGTEFILTFMENVGTSKDLQLFVTTTTTSAVSVEVTAPAFPGAIIAPSNFEVTSGEVVSVLLLNSLRMTGTGVSTKGVRITATEEIVVYGANQERLSNDGFVALPTDVLGKEHFAFSWYPPSEMCEFALVAIEDNTNVNITLPSPGTGDFVLFEGRTYNEGDTISATLDMYGTLQIQSEGDLTGAHVVTDEDVAFFSGNKKTSVLSPGLAGQSSSRDHLVAQLPAVAYWGKRFLSIPTPQRTVGDYYMAIASQADTNVQISHYGSFYLARPGDSLKLLIGSSNYTEFSSDKPIQVVHVVQTLTTIPDEKSDPSMMLIPPIEQYESDYIFTTPEMSTGAYVNFAMIVVKDSEKEGIRLDGNTYTPGGCGEDYCKWNEVPGTEYVATAFNVTEGTHRLKHESPIAVFGAYIYGTATFETYGFPLGMRMAQINTVCIESNTTFGDGLDNDCDSLIDEELCDNTLDDDGDGRINEDCAAMELVNECLEDSPCENSGTCLDLMVGFNCLCTDGYTGTNCETDINECSSSPCLHGSTCTDQVNGYICTCVDGYTGTHCETDINECSNSPCLHGSTCTDQVNGYICTCVDGYTGTHCETDVNECSSSPCLNGSTCTDQPNGYICTCVDGYTGTHCETDINECSSSPCLHGSTCTDQVNGYICTCVDGHTGTHCETDVNECSSSPCLHGSTCTDQVNGFICTCVDGYTGTHCETDINECSTSPCLHGSTCTDQVNGYICTCVDGYTGTHCETDINECSSSPCLHGSTCTDQVNGYLCTCVDGYTGTHCETDINECSSSPCLHGSTCTDKINGYICTCVDGYTGTHCETDIDECLDDPCLNGGICEDKVNGFTCFCEGSLFGGTLCQDVLASSSSGFLSSTDGIIIGISTGSILLLLALIGCCCCCWFLWLRRKKRKDKILGTSVFEVDQVNFGSYGPGIITLKADGYGSPAFVKYDKEKSVYYVWIEEDKNFVVWYPKLPGFAFWHPEQHVYVRWDASSQGFVIWDHELYLLDGQHSALPSREMYNWETDFHEWDPTQQIYTNVPMGTNIMPGDRELRLKSGFKTADSNFVSNITIEKDHEKNSPKSVSNIGMVVAENKRQNGNKMDVVWRTNPSSIDGYVGHNGNACCMNYNVESSRLNGRIWNNRFGFTTYPSDGWIERNSRVQSQVAERNRSDFHSGFLPRVQLLENSGNSQVPTRAEERESPKKIT